MLFLVGPVSTAKSALATRLMELAQVHPFYTLKVGDEISPTLESPLGLFVTEEAKRMVSERFGIPQSRLTGLMSPWALKHLSAHEGDLSKFEVVRVQPSLLNFNGLAKAQKPETDTQGGIGPILAGLQRTSQGLFELMEIFKFDQDALTPLYPATEERMFMLPENQGPHAHEGFLIGHSNTPDWQTFASKLANAGLISRMFVVNVPYCLRATEEEKIYIQMLRRAGQNPEQCAPGTTALLAKFAVLSRLHKRPTKGRGIKFVLALDGEDDPAKLDLPNFAAQLSADDGKDGVHPRWLAKILSNALTANPLESRTDPVKLLEILSEGLKKENDLCEHLPLIEEEVVPYYVTMLWQPTRF